MSSLLSLVQFIHLGPDLGVFEVLAEGTACLLGLILAVVGVIGSAIFGWISAHGAAAIAIGVLVIAFAGIVLAESKRLLTGEAVSPAILAGVREILGSDPRVLKIEQLLSIYQGPETILLAATLDFEEGTTVNDIKDISNRVTARLREVEPRVTRLFLRADGD
jgi:divalent metal cation (Fe/Co/Zn/Cd) transporter